MAQYIYGKNVVKNRLKTKDIKLLYVENNKHQRLVEEAKKKNIEVTFVSKKRLDKLSDNNLHQGLVAKVAEFEYSQLSDIIKDKPYPLIVLLDGVEDPHNFGAIIRTCEAVGVDGIIILNKRSVKVNPTVIKTSVGAIDNMQIVEVNNLSRAIKELKDKGYWIVGTDFKNSQDYRRIDYKMPTVLVVGSEGKGMSRLVRESCDFIAEIPMIGKVNSLNVSVATAVMLYEIFNQQNQL